MSTKTAPPADGKPAKQQRPGMVPLPQLELFTTPNPVEDPTPPPIRKPEEPPYQFFNRFFDID